MRSPVANDCKPHTSTWARHGTAYLGGEVFLLDAPHLLAAFLAPRLDSKAPHSQTSRRRIRRAGSRRCDRADSGQGASKQSGAASARNDSQTSQRDRLIPRRLMTNVLSICIGLTELYVATQPHEKNDYGLAETSAMGQWLNVTRAVRRARRATVVRFVGATSTQHRRG
eukprot:scaffold236345_cov27-Prasinocladus_malaysianus.AAC.1